MAKIYEEVILKCDPEKAYKEISDMNFVRKINPNAGFSTNILFQNDRLVRYTLTVEKVGTWESERVNIPEALTIVTQKRKPLAPFAYLVVVQNFKAHEEGTLFTYIEEFEMDEENKEKEDGVLSDIMKKCKGNLKKIQDYFNNSNE